LIRRPRNDAWRSGEIRNMTARHLSWRAAIPDHEGDLQMSILKKALVAASLAAVVAASTANAASRAELESGYHGNTPVTTGR
jgi:hypothetical protein